MDLAHYLDRSCIIIFFGRRGLDSTDFSVVSIVALPEDDRNSLISLNRKKFLLHMREYQVLEWTELHAIRRGPHPRSNGTKLMSKNPH
jgi:hypothetical protein